MKKIASIDCPERVLLTEVLPYELPLLFGNKSFFEHMRDPDKVKLFKDQFSFEGASKGGAWTIPFDYSIRRNGGKKSRKLSIIHPLTQLDIVKFYKKYDSTMLFHCGKSDFSLRHINSIAQTEYVMDDNHEVPDVAQDNNVIEINEEKAENLFRCYFRYEKYDMAHKFFNGMEFLRLNQKYQYMMTLDIASCFYHIYTHSISWAIKGKSAAKNNIGNDVKTFEQEFDALMEHCNYNETNGIVVGPEVSRIFAEIIMQRIDCNVIKSMKAKGRILGTDYEVRRYVDDHYIYAVDKNFLEECRKIYDDCLQEYKLFVNDNKTSIIERPFISTKTSARQHLSDLFTEWKVTFFKCTDGKYARLNYPDKVLKILITKFCSTAKDYGLQYCDVNRYELSIFRNFIELDLIPALENHSDAVPTNILITLAEFSFYCYSLDMSSTATFRICTIIQLLHKCASISEDKEASRLLTDIFNREIKRCLDIYSTQINTKDTNLEVLNLMLSAISYSDYEIREDRLTKLFGLNKSKGYINMNYFQICVLLHIIKDKTEYKNIKNELIGSIADKFKIKGTESQRDCEMTLLYFDMITCPYLLKSTKEEIVKSFRGITNINTVEKTRAKIEKCGIWFFEWNAGTDLSEYLRKKQIQQVYE